MGFFFMKDLKSVSGLHWICMYIKANAMTVRFIWCYISSTYKILIWFDKYSIFKVLDKSLSWYLSIDFCCELLPYIDLCVMITRVSCIWSSVILYNLNLLGEGGCKYKIYYMQLSYCKFCIYTHPVKSKLYNMTAGWILRWTEQFAISNVK